MPCIFCTNPALCNPVCRAFEFAPDAVKAQMREAYEASGQMTAQEVSAHVEAGEMTCPDCGDGYPGLIDASGFGDLVPCPECKGTGRVEAGEMEAAKGDRK